MISAIKACQNNYNNDSKYENLSAYAEYKWQELVRKSTNAKIIKVNTLKKPEDLSLKKVSFIFLWLCLFI